MSMFGSSNLMKPIPFAGAGILDNDQQLNPDFYNWNKVYVRNCDGASFSGDAEGQAQDGTTLYFKGLHIYEAVIDELMEKGLSNATKLRTLWGNETTIFLHISGPPYRLFCWWSSHDVALR
ncbi:unnamed protein product [Triticum turgidum subsp. durum]|uniref:Pectin acetylesterase n=1 Tax=Triticum turgidum subsp. durum TaxID=4567 RepID=A0A9R1SAP8_TRITD|nr:unnamed protein product [Triticum turgidum subsp. durum]